MPPKKRGFKFTTHELVSLAEAVAKMIPMSNTDWDTVWEAHNESFPGFGVEQDLRFPETQISGDGKDKNPHR